MTEQQRRFEPISSRVSFPQLEEAVLQRWKDRDTFHAVDETRAGAPLFVFYEGPPTANGSPGIHHVLSRSFKDVILRYKTMRGYRPIRRGGWDTHGLPVELEIEKELGLSSKREIEEFGIEEFNRRCRESVFRYVQDWEAMTDRVGVWLDMPNAYVTYHDSYIETAWWIFKRLWDEGLMYEGFRVTPHCPRCVTSLSSHEVALGYQENTPDPSVYVRFPVSEAPSGDHGASPGVLARLGYAEGSWQAQRPAFLAWTTTPWTLTANMALAVGPQVAYVLAEKSATEDAPSERIVIAEALAAKVLGDDHAVVERFTGSELVGITYDPPFSGGELAGHAHRVLAADYVSTEDGTGIVHTAPAYGAEDAELGRANGFETVHTVDLRGTLADGFPGGGKFFKDADKEIIGDLTARGILYRDASPYRHTYPFCWRCSTPLLYYAKSSWYIRTTAVKDQMVAGNQGINWHPEHIKEGRFGEWLRNNIDWAVSRERYWGTPIPIWRCDDCDSLRCIGSTAELAEAATPETKGLVDGLDLHRPFVDRIEMACGDCGGAMHRVPEVADAWFDSGAMPFSQWAYPVTVNGPQGTPITLETPEDLIASAIYPADFITEAVDQTRGWFYSLLALATLLTGQPSYRNVIVLGLILDGKGEKMSKSKGNVVNPWEIVNEHGADALRWYLFTAAPAGAARRFSGDLVQETLRRFLLTLWNTYSFFVTYANIDGFDPDAHAAYWKGPVGGPSLASPPPNELDRWVISELNDLVKTVTGEMEGYSPTDAGRRIEDFVDLLSNWYVRRSRRRFWKSAVASAPSAGAGGPVDGGAARQGTSDADDKTWAHVTLYTCLVTLSRLMAPMTPFLADEMDRNLAPSGSPDSVHLADYPEADESLIDDTLDRAVRLAMRISSLGRAARSKGKVRVRQPLGRVLVRPRAGDEHLLPLIEDQVLEELNVRSVEVAQDDAIASFKLRPNLPVLGPKLGSEVGALREALEQIDPAVAAAQLRAGGPVEAGRFALEVEDLLVDVEDQPGIAAASEGPTGLLVGIDLALTPELEAEGFARELVHRVQNARKNAGFEIEDRIVTYVADADANTAAVLATHDAYVRQETLSQEVRLEPAPAGAHAEDQEIEGHTLTIGVVRAG